ncbi:MAG: TM2 domain-containing protein [Deltaproteobacteria bacterium]|jgi:TM2 domain-containing membrane protein YozV|nr:TM2 domain-containing protein [Deltaproteobacteria bacterium]
MDDVGVCPACGGDLVSTIKDHDAFGEMDPPRVPAYSGIPSRSISPKKRNVVILLCYFLGMFGVHRFYLGKILSGVFMALTLGGLTVWQFIDFVLAINGPLTDSQGRAIGKEYNVRMVHILVVAPLVLLVVGVIVLFFLARYLFQQGMLNLD